MLAKNMKIQTLMAQRHFIIEMMKKVYKEREDGNAIFLYKGIIYPENIRYFSDEGFAIRTLDSERIIAEYGVPLNVFYPKAEIELNESEIMMSEELVKKTDNLTDEDDEFAVDENFMFDLLKKLKEE